MPRVGIFLRWGIHADASPQAMEALRAMEVGALACGCRVRLRQERRGYKPCDIAVMWGCGKRTMEETSCRDRIVEAHGDKPFLRLELGYLLRDTYFSVGLGGLWGHGEYRNVGSPGDRFDRLQLAIEPWQRNPAGHLLVMGQVPWDTSVQHLDFNAWAAAATFALHKLAPDAEVRLRPHPFIKETVPLAEDLRGARAVVTLTSTSAVESLLAGIPTIAMDPGSILWRYIGSDSIAAALDPPLPDRRKMFAELAYTQWSLCEMQSGLPYQHLLGLSRKKR